MKRGKPLFMRTYGKRSRRLPAWISPDNRRRAFESTASDSDISVLEPAKPTRMRISVASHRAVRPAKRKAMVCLKEGYGDEENIDIPSPPHLRPTQKNKTTRKNKLVSTAAGLLRQKAQQVLITSESEDDSTSAPKRCKIAVQRKRNSDADLPSDGRFVTHRRGAVASKPKFPKATVNVLNSSDDFAPREGASGSRRIRRPSRSRAPLALMISSAENSVNAAGSASSAINPFREISLNESADHSLGPCPRKPLFCSTPSARPLSKRPRLKPLPINHQSSTSPSISVSHIGLLSTSQEDMDSPGQPFSPPHSAPVGELRSGEKQQSTLGEPQKEPGTHQCVEPSGHSVMKQRSMNRSSCSEGAKSQNEATETQNGGEVPSQKPLSLVLSETEGSSHFVSAAGGLEWLVEALKDNCLTQRCTVQLERVDKLTETLLHSQTTYSSCLDHSSSVHSRQTTDRSQSFQLVVSVNSNATSESSQLVNSCDSTDHAPSVTDSQSINLSRSVDCNQSAEHTTTEESTEQPTSVVSIESTQHTDNSVEFITDARSPQSRSVEQTLSSYPGTEEMAVAMKEKYLAKKCTVQLKRMALSQLTVTQQLKKFTHPDGHTISRKIDREMASDTQSVYNSRSVDQTQSIGPGTEEREAMLKEKCLTEKLTVEVKRAALSKHKETVQLKDTTLEPPTDVSKSESDHTANTHQRNRRTRSMKVNMKKRGSTNSEDKISSDNEEIVRNPHDILPKRKKASLAAKEKKRRRMSTDRPGTTRKACVSGLNVSRWKNKGNTSTCIFQSRHAERNKVVDCSINELLSTHHKQPKELHGTSVVFSTPVRASRLNLNLSSLLADLTPDTHTWSRLKAALSVHRKTKVLLTPRSFPPPMPSSTGRVELADVSQDLFATPLRTALSERFRSQLLRSASVACEDADLSDAEKVYVECGQQGPLPWEECILPQRMKLCKKIGEGTFGEVFSTTNTSGDIVALKIIPVEGSEKVNGEDQKTFEEILHEIIISKELSSLKEKQQNQTHGFIGLNDLHCVRGCYPPALLTAWDAFDQQKGSENDRPDFFEKEQLFLILEFEFGGSDLENCNGTLANLVVAKSILHQVTAALAVAEQELHFEHRDLHWGNVLVKTTKKKKGSFLLNGTTHSLDTRGVLVRIIDYSLSRLEIDGLTVSCDISADEELFMGQGDYQFDIYRLMRQENGNNWSNYQPHSNVLWLHYLCSKLLSMKYRRPGGRGAKDTREELTRFHDNILQYRSATEALQNCPMFQ